MRPIFAYAACALLALLIIPSAVAASDVEMLPPRQPNSSTPCDFAGTDQILTLHNNGSGGSAAINCNPLFLANPVTGEVLMQGSAGITGNLGVAGNLGIGTGTPTFPFQIDNNGATVFRITPNGIVGANGPVLAPAFYYIDGDSGGGSPSSPPPTLNLPVCAAGYVLTSDGQSLSCVAPASSSSNFSCPSGSALSAMNDGVPVCTTFASSTPQVQTLITTFPFEATAHYLDCPSGQVAMGCISISSGSGEYTCDTYSGTNPSTGLSACVQAGCSSHADGDTGYFTSVTCVHF